MKITLESKRNGILKSQIDSIVAELEKLQSVYTDVIINELTGFDSIDSDDDEARYLIEEKVIEINRDLARELLSEKETIAKRNKLRKRIDKRKQMGIVIDNDRVYDEVRGLISLVRHEFCHAIVSTYSLDSDKDLLELYDSLSEEEIARDLAEYANEEIDEFIAVAFEESFYDCSELAKQVRTMVDDKVGVRNE